MAKQPALRIEVALTRPQLMDELFEVRDDKQLYCRFCGKQIIITLNMRGCELLSTYVQDCDCPRSAERIKLGVIKTAEVVRVTERDEDPFPEGDEGEDQV